MYLIKVLFAWKIETNEKVKKLCNLNLMENKYNKILLNI